MSFSLSACNSPLPRGFSSSPLLPAIHALSRYPRLQTCQLCYCWQYRHEQQRKNARFTSAAITRRPPPGNAFTGREDDLTRLWTSLRPQPSPTRRVAVVHGYNGVGKSRLVAHFSRLHKSDFSTTWWVNGKDKSSVLASLGALASRLPTNEVIPNLAKAPSSGSSLEQQASTVLEWLSRKENSKWLLIFDDVVAHQSAGTRSSDAYSIREFFPPSDQGSILVITGNSDMAEVGESHALRNLSLQESMEFFNPVIKGRTEDGQAGLFEDQARKSLVRQLEGIPLALTHAASYIHQTGENMSGYLQLFQDTQQNLQAITEHECDSPVVTCALSFKEIERLSPRAAKLLRLLSCYDNTRIPGGLLEYGRDNPALPEWFAGSPLLKGRFVRDLQTLSDFSLITASDNVGTYSIHPVVKNWCQDSIDVKQQEELNTIALISVGTAAAQALDGRSPRDRQSLLPHANEMRRMLQNGGLVSASEQTLPAIRSLGSLYRNQGCLAHAEDMYLHVLSRSQALFGWSHSSTRQIISDLQRLRFLRWRPGKIFTSYWWDVILGICEGLLTGLVSLASFTVALLSFLFFWLP